MKHVGFEVEEYKVACDISFDSYAAFMKNDMGKVSEVTKRFREFMREKHIKPAIVIARAGHHIARMATKPFPV